MESFENMKGKLREEGPLPEGFGWEEMQEGIFEKMANLTEPEKEKNRFGYWKLTFFLLGMVATLMLTVVFYFVSNQPQILINKEESIITITPSSQEQIEHQKIATQTENTIENHSTESSNYSQQDAQILVRQQQKSTTDLKIGTKTEIKEANNESPNSAKKVIAIAKENIFKYNASKSTVTANNSTIKISKQEHISSDFEKMESSTKTTSITGFNNNQSLQKTAESIIKVKKDKRIWVLNTLEKKPFNALNYQRLSTFNSLLLVNPLAVEKRGNNTRFSIAIGVGLNHWAPNWGSSSGSQERATYEKALIGNTYSVDLDYRLNKKWVIGTGLMHATHYSKFDYSKEEVFQKVKKDALVEIQVNIVTGDSTQIFGDRTINVNRQRQVVHYNSFQKWSIPLVVKHSLRTKKMEYAFGLGTMLTLTTKTIGKTINSDIQDYDATSPIYQSGFEAGVLGSFDINYHLSDKYYVGAQFSGIKSLKNWSTENEVLLKPTTFNSLLKIGLKF